MFVRPCFSGHAWLRANVRVVSLGQVAIYRYPLARMGNCILSTPSIALWRAPSPSKHQTIGCTRDLNTCGFPAGFASIRFGVGVGVWAAACLAPTIQSNFSVNCPCSRRTGNPSKKSRHQDGQGHQESASICTAIHGWPLVVVMCDLLVRVAC
jgi:hypothetical protein